MAISLKDLADELNEPISDRRKAKRLHLNFSVELSGVDSKGEPFHDRTKTQDISDAGCRLVTKIPLQVGDVVDIRLIVPDGTRLPEEPAQKFKVIWIHEVREGWCIGTRKTTNDKVWKVSFPPPKSTSS